MDKEEPQSCPAGSEQNLVAKRTALEEPDLAPDAKRVKSFHDGLTGPAATRRVPFPEKVCYDLSSSLRGLLLSFTGLRAVVG